MRSEKGGAAGIGSKGDIRITGGELTVSAEGSGAAIGGFTDSYSERVDCKSITINGDVIKSISSKDGACIGGAAGGSVGSITISDAELPLLSSEKVLIGWDADSPGGKLTIRNCRVESTDIPTTHTDGIRVGSNSEIVIENSEIRLPHLRGIRVGGNGSIAVRDSDLHTYGIFMDETVQSPNDAKTLKKLEITGSTVLTGDIIGARGEYSSVEEIVIRGSSIRLNDEYTYNYCTIGGGTGGSFGSIDIQDSQIDITSSLNAPISRLVAVRPQLHIAAVLDILRGKKMRAPPISPPEQYNTFVKYRQSVHDTRTTDYAADFTFKCDRKSGYQRCRNLD